MVVDAGSANDPPGKEGVAALTAATLLEGTSRLSGSELAETFERLGTSVDSGADWDSAFAKITMLSERLDDAVSLLGQVLSEPSFPDREVERLKAERLAEILQLETEPRGLADEKFSEFLYAAESRYSKPDEGSGESVSALSRADVEQFYRARYRTESTTVIIAGDVSLENVRALVEKAFSGWVSGATLDQQLTATARTSLKSVHIIDKQNAPQSELRVGHVGLPRKNPDFFPTLVMNAVLGSSGPGSTSIFAKREGTHTALLPTMTGVAVRAPSWSRRQCRAKSLRPLYGKYFSNWSECDAT